MGITRGALRWGGGVAGKAIGSLGVFSVLLKAVLVTGR